MSTGFIFVNAKTGRPWSLWRNGFFVFKSKDEAEFERNQRKHIRVKEIEWNIKKGKK